MKIQYSNKKILVSEFDNRTLVKVRKCGLNYTYSNGKITLEDNVFNRVLLDLTCDNVYNRDRAPVDKISRYARDYQALDIEKMLQLATNFNRNKPGYGKTFETIEYCRLNNFKKILVICPKNTIAQWHEQFHMWWPEVDHCIIRTGGPGLRTETREIFVTNYEAIVPRKVRGSKQLKYSQTYLKLRNFRWDIMVVDESHRIKNKDAPTTEAIKGVPFAKVMLLTGTPILNKPNDLWSQLHLMGEFYSGSNYWAFVRRFCEMEENGFGEKPVGLTKVTERVAHLARVLALITTGGDNQKVTSGRNMIPIELEMHPKQRELYRKILDLDLDYLNDKGISIMNAMSKYMKQQQCTTNPGYLDSTLEKCNPKFEWIGDWLEDNEGVQLVVFTKFSTAASALLAYLERRKLKGAIYTGATTSRTRTLLVNSFKDGNVGCLIGTIGALGTGIDGLQHKCDNVCFLDCDPSTELNEQAAARVDRSGHVGMTNVWVLNMKNSIDQHIEGIYTRKAEDINLLNQKIWEANNA